MNQAVRQRADELRELFAAKVRAELAAADALAPGADTVCWSGDPLASVAAVKGRPGPAEASGGPALSGADGQALRRALEALGWSPSGLFATVSRPADTIEEDLLVRRLRMQIEAVDPQVVIALDTTAGTDLTAAFGIGPLAAGVVTPVAGRRFLALDDFESALANERTKRLVWGQLKSAAPSGPVY